MLGFVSGTYILGCCFDHFNGNPISGPIDQWRLRDASCTRAIQWLVGRWPSADIHVPLSSRRHRESTSWDYELIRVGPPYACEAIAIWFNSLPTVTHRPYRLSATHIRLQHDAADCLLLLYNHDKLELEQLETAWNTTTWWLIDWIRRTSVIQNLRQVRRYAACTDADTYLLKSWPVSSTAHTFQRTGFTALSICSQCSVRNRWRWRRLNTHYAQRRNDHLTTVW